MRFVGNIPAQRSVWVPATVGVFIGTVTLLGISVLHPDSALHPKLDKPTVNKAKTEPTVVHFAEPSDDVRDIALCIAGGRGAFLEKYGIAKHFYERIVKPLHTDVFIHSDASAAELNTTIQLLLPRVVVSQEFTTSLGKSLKTLHGTKEERRKQAREGKPKGKRAVYLKSVKLDKKPHPVYMLTYSNGTKRAAPSELIEVNTRRPTKCFELIRRYEKRRGSRYSLVMRVRPDEIFIQGMSLKPMVDDMKKRVKMGLNSAFVKCETKGWTCDHPALVPRNASDLFFDAYAIRIHQFGGIPTDWLERNCEYDKGLFIECSMQWWMHSNGLHVAAFDEMDTVIVRSCDEAQRKCGLRKCDEDWLACGENLPRSLFAPVRRCADGQTCYPNPKVQLTSEATNSEFLEICVDRNGFFGECGFVAP